MTPDPRILGHILLLQSALHAAPDDRKMAEFIVAGLTRIPGIAGAAFCREGRILAAGSLPVQPPALCRGCFDAQSAAEGCPLPCPLATPTHVRLALQGIHHCFGGIILDLDQPERFALYRPFLENLANLATLLLENRVQDACLRDLNRGLERQVSERTADLQLELAQRKKAEAERTHLLQAEQAARAQAENATQAKDTFLAMVSHELRTPLTPVMAAVDLLGTLPGMPADAVELLDIIRTNLSSEIRLIHDLLELTRLGAGALPLQRRELNLPEQLAQIISAVGRTAAAKRLAIDFSCSATSPCVLADPVRITQIFTNLLSNAIKFTPPDGRITICCGNPRPDLLALEIADSGIGMDPQIISHLFEPFEQADKTITRRFGGLGLGLYLSRVLVDLHGGRLTARSSGPGQGSVFRVELPCFQPSAAPVPSAGEKAAPGTPQTGMAVCVLLVEDNAASLKLLARFIASQGHQVQCAENASAAREIARQTNLDIVVSDLGLPDTSGWDLLPQLRQCQPGHKLPAIAISGFGAQADIERSRHAGFDDHLVKPLDLGCLARRIQELCATPARP